MANKTITLADIDKGIAQLRGIISNVNERVQEIAVAIVEHAFGTGDKQGSGDVSRVPKLLTALPNSMNRTFLIRWFAVCNIGVDPQKGYAPRVLSKDHRLFIPNDQRVAFARANNWYDAVAEDGTRAEWYEGPTPKTFEPNTIGDFGTQILNFAERMQKRLTAKREVNGREVPEYNLTEADRAEAQAALETLERLGKVVCAREELSQLQLKEQEIRQMPTSVAEFRKALAG